MSTGSLSSRYRTAFVTGASTGLGLAFTEMLLAEGVEVWGTSRDAARLAARSRFHPVALDLTDGTAAERAFAGAERAAGGFDVVVNNAGFGVFGSFAATDFAVWEEQMRVMLVNTARLAHVALRGMLARRRGALVNVASIAGEFALPYQPAYNTVKAGLSALSESLMYEVKGSGVVVLETRGARVDAVAVKSPHILNAKGATYAQSADWGVEEAEGFIKLFGMSSTLYAQVNR